MTIDDVQEIIEYTPTLSERLAQRRSFGVIAMPSQFRGNRITSHFYPEHWAQVQLARATVQRWSDE